MFLEGRDISCHDQAKLWNKPILPMLQSSQASVLHASLSVPSPEQILEGSEPGLHSPVLVLSPPPQVAEQSLQAAQQPYWASVETVDA